MEKSAIINVRRERTMDKRDFPKLGNTEASNNNIRGGSLLCTRGFLRRMCVKAGLVAAMCVGMSYVINAADGMINGNNYDDSSAGNNRNKRNNNGRK